MTLLTLLDSEDRPNCAAMLGSVIVWRRRFSTGAVDAGGRWRRGASDDEPICATWQPSSGASFQAGRQGHTSVPDRIALFVPDADTLRATDEHTQLPADRVYVPDLDATYEVQAVGFHAAPWLRHRQVIAIRVAIGHPEPE